MCTVFIHGAPETAAVWDPLLAELEHLGSDRPDVICLSPPGFGAPLPTGFSATVDAYRDWLIDELTRFPEPVDLVGHDWGGAHALNAVMSRPDLVRSWVSDVIGLFDSDYVWNGERAAQRPGLALLATEDYVVVGTNQQRRHSAQRAGARTETLEGLGHWWMTQDPERGARVLIDFWASLDR